MQGLAEQAVDLFLDTACDSVYLQELVDFCMKVLAKAYGIPDSCSLGDIVERVTDYSFRVLDSDDADEAAMEYFYQNWSGELESITGYSAQDLMVLETRYPVTAYCENMFAPIIERCSYDLDLYIEDDDYCYFYSIYQFTPIYNQERDMYVLLMELIKQDMEVKGVGEYIG